MTTERVQIVNGCGLHARPASLFVKLAKSFVSEIEVRNVSKDKPYVSAKSVIRLLTAEICQGEWMEMKANGPDEEEAVRKLKELVVSGFGE